MNRVKGLLVALAVPTVAILAVACSNGEAASTATPEGQSSAPAVSAPAPTSSAALPSAPSSQPSVAVPPVGSPEPGRPAVSVPPSAALPLPPVSSATSPRAPVVASAPAAVGPVAAAALPIASPIGVPLLQSASGGQAGIWVSGQGRITLEPDLAVLNLGVEANALTVAAAREEAGTAMDAIVTSLTGNGVAEKDIQTRFFNISPQYEFTQVTQNGIRTNKQVLVGYRVSNTAAVKIRDLSAVGPIIDDVAVAGGDATRINGISFTVEDTSPFLVDLRADAVNDALAKAAQFAQLTSVSLGNLVFISESGAAVPQARSFEEFGAVRAFAAAAPDTSISGGELEITLSVQAVFAIQ